MVCVGGDRPLDPARWRAATAGLPALGEPVQYRWADLPTTATWKLQRPELARLLDRARLTHGRRRRQGTGEEAGGGSISIDVSNPE